jgi:hypothetical protein
MQNMHGDNPLRLREKMHDAGPPGLKSRLHTSAPTTGPTRPDRPARLLPKVSRLNAHERRLLLQHRDVGEIAVLLAVVEAVADDEVVLDRESDILHAHVDLAA